MRVVVVAEYYPRAGDPVLGVWAHRQALAARDAGAEVRVVVLHRPLPGLSALRRADFKSIGASLRRQPRARLDGIEVDYVHFVSPPRPMAYATWGAWAAPALARRLRSLRRSFAYDLVHAHYAVPAADAVLRTGPRVPLVVSVHGGDVLGVVQRGPRSRAVVRRALGRARLVIANSTGTAERCREHGATDVRVVHLGTDVPDVPRAEPATPTLVTVGHLVARKRHADVVRALATLAPAHPELRYVVVGDGPQRLALRTLALQLGVEDRVELCGQLAPADAVARARSASLFVMPSVDEALGVAYLEAMAAGVPAIGCRGEAGPEEIAAAGEGMVLVAPRDPAALADEIGALLRDPARLRRLGEQARATVQRSFTWARCGRDTVAAYEAALT